jgi:hypothetical protein
MAKKATTVKPKAAADLAAKASESRRADAADLNGAKATAKTLVDQVQAEDDGVDLATASEEAKMRKAATSPAARKAALAAGKKDPLEKWGDPDANLAEIGGRRAAFGL